MIVPGLMSVTLRQCDVRSVVGVAADSGLTAIHWSGDVHVPVGDFGAAELARGLCAGAGIEIEGYGSYYRSGESSPEDFDTVVRTAEVLGAPHVRVWAGTRGSAVHDLEARERIVADISRCGEIAAERGIDVVLEYHPDTLTDDIESATSLVAATGVRTYWQPGPAPNVASCVNEVHRLGDAVVGAHVFAWGRGGYVDRLPLAERSDLWRPVLSVLGSLGDRRYALLEFVTDDSVAGLARDAQSLIDMIE